MTPAEGMIPTLLHVPWYRSSMPYQLAIELGIPSSELAIKQLSIEELRNEPGIEKISPRRVVPALAISPTRSVLETGAIMLYLLERFDGAGRLHPPAGDPRRPTFLQGLFHASSAYHALRLLIIHSDGDGAVHASPLAPAPAPAPAREKLEVAVAECKRVIVDHLDWALECSGGAYYVGDEFSAVDIMFGYLFACWEQCLPVDYGSEVVKQYVGRLKVRPSYMHLYLDEDAVEDSTDQHGSQKNHSADRRKLQVV